MVDDDQLMMSTYETVLKMRKFEVTRFHGQGCVDRALGFLEKESASVDIMVIDIMMPPGEAFKDEDTDQGMRTGVFLLERLNAQYPSIPSLVLTNVQDEAILEAVRKVAPQLRILRKPQCPPLDLVKIIQSDLGCK